MRIESVVIKNINSLEGRFEVDFTDGKYAEGLFAIVGPSGAGKTTVLDAVCLALYGKTPRIDTISETQDEIMSKNCGDCAAEAVFVSRGKRYKAVFSHQRGRGEKPFRQVKREIWEYDEEGKWSVIASMIKDANEKIVEITGLTYSQFTRSIMLAQFQFAEFLKADSNERAAILEQISDMNIYRDISAAVYERAKRERAALSDIEAKKQALKVLDGAQLKAYEDEINSLAASVTLHNKLRERFTACRDTAEGIKKYNEELAGFKQDEPVLAAKLEEQAKLFEQAQREETEAKAALEALQKTLKTVRELDSSIAVQSKDIARIDGEITQNAEKVNAQKRGILGVFKKYVPGASGEEFKRLYDTEDIGGILRAGAKAELDGAVSAEKQISGEISAVLQGKDEAYWHKRADALKIYVPAAEAREAVRLAGEKLQEQRRKHEQLKQAAGELEAQENVIDEKLVYAKLEEKFGEERRKLESGKPCPLCGATEHPGAGKPFDSKFLEDVQRQKEDIAKRVKQAQQELAASVNIIAELEKTISEKTLLAEQKEKELAALGADIGEISAEQAAAELAAAEKIIRLYMALLGRLSAAKDNVTNMTAKLGDVDKDLAAVHAAKQAIADYETETSEKQKQRSEAAKLLAQYKEKRTAMFGEKDADAEEESAKRRSEQALKEKDACRERRENAARACEQNKSDIARTQEHINNKSRELDMGFADAKLGVMEAQGLPVSPDEGIKAVFERFTVSAAGLSGNAAEKTDKFAGLIDILNTLSSEETARQGAVRQMLKENAQNIKALGELKDSAKQQEQTCERWDRLNALIGSADGIKFSRMAQGFTFEVLLRYANSCLGRMTDRYALVRDTGNASKPLELAIVDNYQAGDRRPVSNLSGGESFMVSLALALGMSEMSSGKTRIDSLFIDEGFASLDDDYLEAALQTLSSLGNREGKLVGVISHVAALKERIDTQIEVKKLSGGRSTLAGPGVRAAGE